MSHGHRGEQRGEVLVRNRRWLKPAGMDGLAGGIGELLSGITTPSPCKCERCVPVLCARKEGPRHDDARGAWYLGVVVRGSCGDDKITPDKRRLKSMVKFQGHWPLRSP